MKTTVHLNKQIIRTGIRQAWLIVFFLLFLNSCKDSVKVTKGPDAPKVFIPDIKSVTIATPSSSPHYSTGSELTISGLCENGHIVHLSGAAQSRYKCESKSYSFNLSVTEDGVYNYFLIQSFDGGESEPTPFTWNRKTTVPPPDITNPPASVYQSSEAILNIEGNCETGARISISGDGIGSTTCEKSKFSLSLPKFTDGDYTLILTQTDLAGNSADITFMWQKRALIVTPDDPTIIVTQGQQFSPSGGSGTYTMSLTENNSGATFDSETNEYTAGTTAYVTDTLLLKDSLGATQEILITVAPGAADHFTLPDDSGDEQSQTIGKDYASPLQVKVVDLYGNGVPAVPLIFVKEAGDVEFIDSSLQTTGPRGEASLMIKQGHQAAGTRIRVKPLGPPLPDVSGSGQELISLGVQGLVNNNGDYDLNFTTGVNPDFIIEADLNSDANTDLVILNKGDPSIGLFQGLGTGQLASQIKISPICPTPYALNAADFNKDGAIDLILTCSDKYSFFSGQGDGTFAAPVDAALDDSENLLIDVGIADFNEDGNLDLAMVSAGLSAISVRFGNGDGSFDSPSIVSTGGGSSPSQIVIGDFDNQNGTDFVVIDPSSDGVLYFANDGSGGFGAFSSFYTGAAPSDVKAADYNNDGFLDISVLNNIDNNISVLLNDQDGGFNLGINTITGQGPTAHAVMDLDNDGFLDAFVANGSDRIVSHLKGLGNGTFTSQAAIFVGSNPLDMLPSDLNNDNVLDLLVVNNGDKSIQMIPGQVTGTLGFLSDTGASPKDIKTGDLTGDGYMDQAIVNSADNNITLLRGNGLGLFAPFGTVSTSSGPVALELNDLDQDGDLDLIVVNQNVNSTQVFLNDGTGTFSTPNIYPCASQPSTLIIEDFNGDGLKDFVVANSGADKLSFFPGAGDGTFGTRMDSNTGQQPSSLSAADFNADGIIDLAATHQSGSKVGIFIGNGDGTFQAPTEYDTQVGPSVVVTGFFNPDLNVDVAVANSLSSSVSVFFGNGDGSLSSPSNYSIGSNPVAMQLADLNGDKYEDLIVANGLDQKATILFGSFFGDFTATKVINTNINTIDVDVSDFNNDGAIDLIFIDGTNDQTKVMQGL